MSDSSSSIDHALLQSLFLKAIAESDPAKRSDIVLREAAANAPLCDRLLALLAANDADVPLPPVPSFPSLSNFPPTAIPQATPGTEITSRYKLLEPIGEGGMGAVWMAQQRIPVRRLVALKLIKPGMDSRAVITRFEAERQALALMDHPNIAKVLDGGTTDWGAPYFVMELVRGLPITEYADQRRLSIKQRLELFTQVCSAVQHAHQKGIIHRDIKPSNVLVTESDGGAPLPKVIDFGLAKALSGSSALTNETLHTAFGHAAGTPLYMAPEQLAISALDVDTRADIYALGVLLYELLTGTTPHTRDQLKEAAWDEIRRVIREDEPPKPSTRLQTSATLPSLAASRQSDPAKLPNLLKGDLDWILLKTLDKDRNRRYESATGLAADINRHLMGDPVHAAPPTWTYRSQKFFRRHRFPVIATTVFVLVLIVSVVTTGVLSFRLKRQVTIAHSALQQAEQSRQIEVEQRALAESAKVAAQAASRKAEYSAARTSAQYFRGQSLQNQALLNAAKAYRLGGGWEDGLLLQQIVDDSRRNWGLEHSIPITGAVKASVIVRAEEGTLLVYTTSSRIGIIDLDNGLKLRETKLTFPVRTFCGFRSPSKFVIANDGKRLVSISLADLTVSATYDVPDASILAVDTSEQNVALTTSAREAIVLSADLKELERMAWPQDVPITYGQPLDKLAISPDGNRVLFSAVTWSNKIACWNRANKTRSVVSFPVNRMHFVDNSNLVGAALNVNVAAGYAVWAGRLVDDDSEINDQRVIGDAPQEDVGDMVAFSANTRAVYVAGDMGCATVHLATRQAPAAPAQAQRFESIVGATSDNPHFCCLADDGSRVVITHAGSLLVFRGYKVRETPSNKGLTCSFSRSGLFTLLSFSPSNATLEVTSIDHKRPRQAFAFNPKVSPSRPEMEPCTAGIAVSEDQSSLAVLYIDSDWHLNSGFAAVNPRVIIYNLDPATGEPKGVRSTIIPLNPDEVAERSRYIDGRLLYLSPDGGSLAVGSVGRSGGLTHFALFNTQNGSAIKSFSEKDGFRQLLCMSVASRYLVSADQRSLHVFDIKTGALVNDVSLDANCRGGCVSSDGQFVIVGEGIGKLSVRSLPSGAVAATLNSTLVPLAWSPSQGIFAAMKKDSGTRRTASAVLADTTTGEIHAIIQRGVRLNAARPAFSPDGVGLILGTDDLPNDILRNMTPEIAVRFLLTAEKSAPPSSLPLAYLGKDTSPANESSDTASAEFADAILATDSKTLQAHMGSTVQLRGRIASVRPTRAKNAVNLIFDPPDIGPIAWVPINAFSKFPEGYFDGLEGQEVVVSGRLTNYAGKSPDLMDRPQVTVDSPGDVKSLQVNEPEPK